MRSEIKVEIADIFRQYFEDYCKKYKVTNQIRKIVTAITSCRTAKLGGHVEVCDNCGHHQISYNSCRDRHCPKCQFTKKEKWVFDKNKDVLPVQYFHVVFTIPSQLNKLMYANMRLLYDLLLRCAGRTIIELGLEKERINGLTGAICVLHTWGQKLDLHPHVHCIVPGGGLTDDKSKWISCKKDYLLPIEVLSQRFRRLFLDELKKLYRNNKLFLKGSLLELDNPVNFQKLIDELYQIDWVVYAKKPFKNVQTVITYLSRYTHRIAISNYRILKLEDDYVYFTYRDYKNDNKKKVMRLHAVEFIRRFLLHVLPKKFVKIRYVGFLSNRTRAENIKRLRAILHVKLEDIPDNTTYDNFADFLFDVHGFDVKKCPKCGGRFGDRIEINACYDPQAP